MQGLCHQLLPCPAFSEDKNGLVASGKNLPFLFQGHDGIAAADDAFEGIQAARLFTDLLLEIVALFFKIMNRVQKFLHPFRADAGGNAFDDDAVKFPLVIQQRVAERNPLRVGGGQAGTERRLPCADSGHDALFGGKEKVGNGIYGDYAVCQGPQSYYWGGTWICAAAGTDNPNLIKEIMQTMTCDKDTEVQITKDTQDYTNTISGMNELANSDFKSDFLGGQNHIKLFAEAAPKINMKNISAYDQGLNEEFQKAMKDYFDGNVTKDKALDNFYKAATEKYPNLTH